MGLQVTVSLGCMGGVPVCTVMRVHTLWFDWVLTGFCAGHVMQTITAQEGGESLGLAGGGKAIAKCKAKFTSLLELLVRIASLQVRLA